MEGDREVEKILRCLQNTKLTINKDSSCEKNHDWVWTLQDSKILGRHSNFMKQQSLLILWIAAIDLLSQPAVAVMCLRHSPGPQKPIAHIHVL